MNKLVSIALISLLTISGFAQKQKRPEFTADQMAQIQTKKMALHLDLSEKQQGQLLEINKKNAVERKQKKTEMKALRTKGEKPSSDELAQRKIASLDKRMAVQKQLKNVLTETQFEKWQKTRTRKMRVQKKRKMHKRIKNHRKGMKRKMRK